MLYPDFEILLLNSLSKYSRLSIRSICVGHKLSFLSLAWSSSSSFKRLATWVKHSSFRTLTMGQVISLWSMLWNLHLQQIQNKPAYSLPKSDPIFSLRPLIPSLGKIRCNSGCSSVCDALTSSGGSYGAENKQGKKHGPVPIARGGKEVLEV